MSSQIDKIINGNWKHLIVLDACRYDYFSDQCKLSGKLEKVISPAFKGEGTPTSVWYKNIFQEKLEDVIHVSAHPRVNSKTEVEGFEGFKKFSRVIDLWDTKWDEENGTVLPEDVTGEALKLIEEFPEKKLIIHYMQPHTPYLSLGPPSVKKKQKPQSRKSSTRKIRKLLVSVARKIIGDKKAVNLMKFMEIPPLSPMDDALRKVGEGGVRKAYRKNLSRVLDCVENFIENSEGKCVITSDHGELLGEGGRFGHLLNRRPELVEVPWFEVENH